MFLPKGYVLKLTIIENWLKILMKQGRIQPVYVLSSTKERKRIKKFNKCIELFKKNIILNIIIL